MNIRMTNKFWLVELEDELKLSCLTKPNMGIPRGKGSKFVVCPSLKIKFISISLFVVCFNDVNNFFGCKYNKRFQQKGNLISEKSLFVVQYVI